MDVQDICSTDSQSVVGRSKLCRAGKYSKNKRGIILMAFSERSAHIGSKG